MAAILVCRLFWCCEQSVPHAALLSPTIAVVHYAFARHWLRSPWYAPTHASAPLLTPPPHQAALLPRVSGHPAKAAEQAHVAHALVPARVAHLLRGEPQLVAAAVEAFHYRDPDDVRVGARLQQAALRGTSCTQGTGGSSTLGYLQYEWMPVPVMSKPGWLHALVRHS